MSSGPRAWNQRADELASEHRASNEPTGWFDRLYSEAVHGSVTMPWDRTDPHPALRQWVVYRPFDGAGRRSVVVGCGLGADAAFLSERGFDSTGFDLSPTAIGVARERFGESGVDFRAADLRDLPPEWLGAFDLVVEIFTLQAVPDPPRTELMGGVRSLVAPGGTLLAIQFRQTAGEQDSTDGPPYALGERRMRDLAGDTLTLVSLEQLDGPLWRAEYHRPTG